MTGELLNQLPVEWPPQAANSAEGVVACSLGFSDSLPTRGVLLRLFEAHAATLTGAAQSPQKQPAMAYRLTHNSETIREYEHIADDVQGDARGRPQPFLTPFDRGAMTSLTWRMDDAIDEMHRAARAPTSTSLREPARK